MHMLTDSIIVAFGQFSSLLHSSLYQSVTRRSGFYMLLCDDMICKMHQGESDVFNPFGNSIFSALERNAPASAILSSQASYLPYRTSIH